MTAATESPATPEKAGSSVDPAEIAKFAAMAQRWWDPEGPMKPLHRLNPTRLTFLRDRLAAQSGRPVAEIRPLAGLRVLDIGCGAGLVSEPLARLGATVVGADATAENIEAARAHAAEQSLEIDYRATTAEALLAAGESFDAVLALEIIEHVAEPAAFLADVTRLVKPGGQLLLSTLNRTSKAWLMAIVGAEWILRWLPRGTHEWKRFLKPSEIGGMLRPLGFEVTQITGLVFNPVKQSWSLSARDLDVNYLLSASRPAA